MLTITPGGNPRWTRWHLAQSAKAAMHEVAQGSIRVPRSFCPWGFKVRFRDCGGVVITHLKQGCHSETTSRSRELVLQRVQPLGWPKPTLLLHLAAWTSSCGPSSSSSHPLCRQPAAASHPRLLGRKHTGIRVRQVCSGCSRRQMEDCRLWLVLKSMKHSAVLSRANRGCQPV